MNSNLGGEGMGGAFIDAGSGEMILQAVPIAPSSFDRKVVIAGFLLDNQFRLPCIGAEGLGKGCRG